MNSVTMNAFLDELEKIAHDSNGGVGQLVFPDRDPFPSEDTGGKDTAKRQDRTFAYPTTTTTSPDPEARVPAADEQTA